MIFSVKRIILSVKDKKGIDESLNKRKNIIFNLNKPILYFLNLKLKLTNKAIMISIEWKFNDLETNLSDHVIK